MTCVHFLTLCGAHQVSASGCGLGPVAGASSPSVPCSFQHPSSGTDISGVRGSCRWLEEGDQNSRQKFPLLSETLAAASQAEAPKRHLAPFCSFPVITRWKLSLGRVLVETSVSVVVIFVSGKSKDDLDSSQS